ncbi:MAG: protein BatD [Pedosphaera sp.]|nr:protein BatD [Pedosphaera sp.]
MEFWLGKQSRSCSTLFSWALPTIAAWVHRIRLRTPAFLISCWLLALVNSIAQAQPSVTASLDRDTITLGETAALTLRFEGGRPAQAPGIPATPNLTVQYAGNRSEFQMINGRSSSALILTYQLTPSAAGEYSIPAISSTVDRQRISTQPVKLRVLPADASASGNGQARYAFIKLIPARTNVFVGEVFPVDMQLYFAVRGEGLQIPQIQTEGFVFSPVQQDPRNQDPPGTQIGAVSYKILSFHTTATAAKIGTLTLGPAQASLVIHIPVNNARRARDAFEDFFDFGPRAQKQQVTLTSDPVSIEVSPVPTIGQPADFSGAVGSYTWTVTASPTNVTVGDPITLKIQLRGEGALDSLALPAYDWREFKSYPPITRTEPEDQLGIRGVKTFEQVIIPQNADVKEIPSLSFTFFDTRRKGYQTLKQPAVPVTVKPGSGGQPQIALSSGASPSSENRTDNLQDIAHIRPYLGQLTIARPPLLHQRWFLALQTVPLLGWLAVATWRRRQDSLARNPRRRRRAEVAAVVRRSLNQLPGLAKADNAAEFFATLFRLLQEQLGERLDLPASAITESVLDDRLPALGATSELVAELHELFRSCNQALYAGPVSSQQLMSLVPKAEIAIRQLQQL